MGNSALKPPCSDVRVGLQESDEKVSRSQEVVTLMNRDGTHMKFAQEFTVSKLLRDFPGHVVCEPKELGSLGESQILCPKTLLMRGKTYFVLPRPQHQKQKRKAGSKCAKVNPVVSSLGTDSKVPGKENRIDSEEMNTPPAPGTIKIMMTKQQLAKMIAEGSIRLTGTQTAHDFTHTYNRVNAPQLRYCSMRLFNHPQASESISASSKRNWFPELDSIVEVPTQ